MISFHCGKMKSHNFYYYIHTEIYAPKSIEIKIVSFAFEKPADWSYDFFTSEKRRIDAMIGDITIFTSEQNHVAHSLLLLADK